MIKKFLTCLLLFFALLTTESAMAQGVRVHMKSGKTVDVRVDETDSLTFSTALDFASSYPKDTVYKVVKDTVVQVVRDTVRQTVTNTVYETITDTLYKTITDTVYNTVTEIVRDTIYKTITEVVTDTLYKTVTDTLYQKVVETVYVEVPDTFYLSERLSFSHAEVLAQHNMEKWSVPPGNYSGITWLGGNRYAVISDKQEKDGWFEFAIDLDESTGDITNVEFLGLHADQEATGSARDAEGIVYCPSRNSWFISAESDQQVLEYDKEGIATGTALEIPEFMSTGNIYSNYGFEALAYSANTKRFWTTTEQGLIRDGSVCGFDSPVPSRHRLVSFDKNLKYIGQWPYITDAPTVSVSPMLYAFGIPELTALPDGSLLVLEREFVVAQEGCYVTNKLYQTRPGEMQPCGEDAVLTDMTEEDFLPKTLVTEWTTELVFNAADTQIANYEGMCLGPRLPDGRMTMLFVSDSQNNYGMSGFHLFDYIRVVVLTPKY